MTNRDEALRRAERWANARGVDAVVSVAPVAPAPSDLPLQVPRLVSGVTLLMTATVNPRPGLPALPPADPAQRMGDYLQALGFYLGLLGTTIRGLVVVEGSGSDVGPLRRLVGECPRAADVEILSVPAPGHPAAYGRAYEEFALVDHVMRASELIRALEPDDKVWKVTGRYRVTNLPELVARAPARYDVYCWVRNWPMRSVDLNLIGWSVRGYDAALSGIYRELREDGPGEAAQVHARALLDGLDRSLRVVRRHATEPRIEAIGPGGRRRPRRPVPRRPVLRLRGRRVVPRIRPWAWA